VELWGRISVVQAQRQIHRANLGRPRRRRRGFSYAIKTTRRRWGRVRRTEPESSVIPPPTAREIPRSQFGRTRAWVKYGMTVAQVAQVCGVPVSQIERIFGKA